MTWSWDEFWEVGGGGAGLEAVPGDKRVAAWKEGGAEAAQPAKEHGVAGERDKKVVNGNNFFFLAKILNIH